jgi:hypothetical protein
MATNNFYIFRKPGFKKRQSEKLRDPNNRRSIFVDVGIANDSKIMLIHAQKDHTLFVTFLHILTRIKTESETWEVREDEFKNWFRRTFDVNNRFNIEKRLEWLSEIGLIEFERITTSQIASKQLPNDVLIESKQLPNDVLIESKQLPNDVLIESKQLPNDILKGKVYPLEQAKTSVALRATISKQSITSKAAVAANTCARSPAREAPPPQLLTKFQPVLVLSNTTTGDTVSEEDWIFRGVIGHLKGRGSRVNLLSQNLPELCALNPDGKKLVYSWLSYPPAERMAAAAYAHRNPGVVNEVVYALQAIEKGWDGYKKLLPIAEEASQANDYTVEV